MESSRSLTSPVSGSSSSRPGERTSSAKYMVCRARASSSGRMATRYSLFRITRVAMADFARVGHGLPQQCVRLVGAGALGRQVVAGPEVDGVDVGQPDEVGDLDLARLLRLGGLELLVAEDDVLAAAEVEARGRSGPAGPPRRSAR